MAEQEAGFLFGLLSHRKLIFSEGAPQYDVLLIYAY